MLAISFQSRGLHDSFSGSAARGLVPPPPGLWTTQGRRCDLGLRLGFLSSQVVFDSVECLQLGRLPEPWGVTGFMAVNWIWVDSSFGKEKKKRKNF